MTARRVILATFGSDGDVNPFLAIGERLKALGLTPVLATREAYRAAALARGLDFHPLRPDMSDLAQAGLDEQTAVRGLTHPATGLRFLFKRMVLPFLHMTFEDLNAVVRAGDLLVHHQLLLAAPIVADHRRLRRLTAVLQPFSLMSPLDPPVLGMIPWLDALRPVLPPWVYRRVFKTMAQVSAGWFAPVGALRESLGLARGPANPTFNGQMTDQGGLALYSPAFAPLPADAPPGLVQTGFPVLTPASDAGLDPALEAFLAAGPAPIVFTLGTTAVLDPGAFYRVSLAAAERLGRRAVLQVGERGREGLPADLPPSAFAVSYAPHALLLPRALAVVHQGGIGTSAQALRAGRPQLVVPFLGDQPDNAARLSRLGVARRLTRERYNAASAAKALDALITAPAYAQKAETLRLTLADEDGAAAAAAEIARRV